MQLDYGEDEKEEGELSDTEDGNWQQVQLWWQDRGLASGVGAIFLHLVCCRDTRLGERWRSGSTRNPKEEKWQGGKLQAGATIDAR